MERTFSYRFRAISWSTSSSYAVSHEPFTELLELTMSSRHSLPPIAPLAVTTSFIFAGVPIRTCTASR